MWFKRRGPEDPFIELRDRARHLLEAGEAGLACRAFEEALALRPDDPKTLTEWGIALLRAHQETDAITVFQRAAQILPLDADVCYWLGEGHRAAGKNDWAIAQYRLALLRDPGHEGARSRLAATTVEWLALDPEAPGDRREQQAHAMSVYRLSQASFKHQRSLRYRLSRWFRRS